EIDVYVDYEVAFSSASIEYEWFFVLGFANLDETVGPFGVVVVVTIRIVIGEDARTGHALHFPLGHLPVQRVGDDDVYVVDTMPREHVENDLENGLTNVRRGHWRKRQTDVVNRNRDLHARFQLCE